MTNNTDAATALKQTLERLDVQRKSLEMEGEAIISELTFKPENGGAPMGIETPLVDQDGYPRADIDVYRARELRNRLAIIKTDIKSLSSQIEQSLRQLALLQNPEKSEEESNEVASRIAPKPKPKYDPVTGNWVVKNWDGTLAGAPDGDKRSFETLDKNASQSNESTKSISAISSGGKSSNKGDRSCNTATFLSNNRKTIGTNNSKPFARIDAVAPTSPAAEAGLQAEDLIVEFGTIQESNHDHLRALLPVVTSAAEEQRPVQLIVMRNTAALQLTLFPRPWPGRGLIGCHILPLVEE